MAQRRTPFAVRRDSPFPSRTLRDDLRQQASSGSNTTGLGLNRAESAISSTPPRNRLFVPADLPEDTEYYLDKVDGLAYCWHPERLMMVPMVFCVWHQYPGDWQPLECIPPTVIAEYLRRSVLAEMHLDRMLRKEPREWVSKHPEPETFRLPDEAFTTYPGQPDYEEGNVPREPEFPRKIFTSLEVFLCDSTARKFERHHEQPAPYPTVLQVLRGSLQDHALSINVFGRSLTVNLTTQTVRENHGVVVGDSSTVRSVTINNLSEAGGRVVNFQDNANYRADLAQE